jgi:hypothetical protein
MSERAWRTVMWLLFAACCLALLGTFASIMALATATG